MDANWVLLLAEASARGPTEGALTALRVSRRLTCPANSGNASTGELERARKVRELSSDEALTGGDKAVSVGESRLDQTSEDPKRGTKASQDGHAV